MTIGGPAAQLPGDGGAGHEHLLRSRQRGRSARAREDRRVGYLLITPTVVIVFAMVVLPILWTISLVFQQVRLLNLRKAGFIGDYSLENFTDVLGSSGFVDALVTTLVYSVAGTACAIGLGLLAALALRKPFRGRGSGARVHARAVRRPGRRRDLRVEARCSTRSSGSPTTTAPRCWAGTSPIAFLSSSEQPLASSASTCTSARRCSAWCSSRPGGPSRSPSSSSPRASRRSPTASRRRPWSTARRRRSASGTSCCPSCCRRSPC